MKSKVSLTLDKEILKKAKTQCKKVKISLSNKIDELLKNWLENENIIQNKNEILLNEIAKILDDKLSKYAYNDKYNDKHMDKYNDDKKAKNPTKQSNVVKDGLRLSNKAKSNIFELIRQKTGDRWSSTTAVSQYVVTRNGIKFEKMKDFEELSKRLFELLKIEITSDELKNAVS